MFLPSDAVTPHVPSFRCRDATCCESDKMTSLMHQFVSGLKSRNEETRTRAVRDLNHYVSTELREISVDDLTAFMDEFNHQIFEMVSSRDVNEWKGGILAIGRVTVSPLCSSSPWVG